MISEKIYALLPHFLQELLVTIFDLKQYRKRHGKKYHFYKKWFADYEFKSYEELNAIQFKRLKEFLHYVHENSEFYRDHHAHVDLSSIKNVEDLSKLPSITKEEIRKNLKKIVTISENDGHVSKTGGTTGKSLKIYFDLDDFQERFAFLDLFRERFGYFFGAKTAWLSGKSFTSKTDIKKNRYWKRDFAYNIKYYSTFHINEKTIPHYIKDFQKYRPEFIVGFPSSIFEIANYGLKNNLPLGYSLKAIFPTAETLVENECMIMKKYFGCDIRNQYASSEGANFITECEQGKLHYEILSGVIEVVDDMGQPAKSGRMLLTSFTTRGTPLVRYDIGDTVTLSDEKDCPCGRKTPLIESIEGRINDFIYSKERGKINLGNISNCVKYVNGIVRFQIIQNELDSIRVLIVKDDSFFKKDEQLFLNELRARLGDKLNISFEYPEDIHRESSGKLRIVKNNIKELI